MILRLKRMLRTVAITSLTAFTFASSIEAAPWGTPTIVTNDASSPVPVTGIVTVSSMPSSYKPVGITTATIGFDTTYYLKSSLCAAQYSSSRICSTAELMNAAGQVTAPTSGAWVMPIVLFWGNYVVDVSGAILITGTGSVNYSFSAVLSNNDIVTPNTVGGLGIARPVVCCAP